jgi:hypothetical protein
MINKALLQLVAAVLAAVVPAFADTTNWTDLSHWVNVLILAVGAYQVWNADNTTYWPMGKMYASLAMSVLMIATGFVTDGVLDVGEIVQLVIAALTPFGVYAVRNTGSSHRPIAT